MCTSMIFMRSFSGDLSMIDTVVGGLCVVHSDVDGAREVFLAPPHIPELSLSVVVIASQSQLGQGAACTNTSASVINVSPSVDDQLLQPIGSGVGVSHCMRMVKDPIATFALALGTSSVTIQTPVKLYRHRNSIEDVMP